MDESPPAATLPDTPPPDKETVSQTLTTTQWLAVVSIGLSLIGLYYKRQEIKNSLSKIKAPASAPAQTAPASANAPVIKTPKKVGIQTMA